MLVTACASFRAKRGSVGAWPHLVGMAGQQPIRAGSRPRTLGRIPIGTDHAGRRPSVDMIPKSAGQLDQFLLR